MSPIIRASRILIPWLVIGAFMLLIFSCSGKKRPEAPITQPPSTGGQQPGQPYSPGGQVNVGQPNQPTPIEGVVVYDGATGIVTAPPPAGTQATDSSGNVSTEIMPGRYAITADKAGLAKVTQIVNINIGQKISILTVMRPYGLTSDMNVTVSYDPTAIAKVKVDAKAQDGSGLPIALVNFSFLQLDTPDPNILDFGIDSIFRLPLSTTGTGKLLVKSFLNGQEVIFITANVNRDFVNYSGRDNNGNIIPLPLSTYDVVAQLLGKGTSSLSSLSMTGESFSLDEDENLFKDPYTGMPYTGKKESSDALTKRLIADNRAHGIRANLHPTSDSPIKLPSAIQKGEVRAFMIAPDTTDIYSNIFIENSYPRPPIFDEDGNRFDYPRLYRAPLARLVGIGEHCYIFLTTEVNQGFPDKVRFTQERINRLVTEFDNHIFPTIQDAMAPIAATNERYIYYPPLDVQLTADDFEEGGGLGDTPNAELAKTEVRDDRISNDGRIIIAIIPNTGAGGLFFPRYGTIDRRPTQQEPDPAPEKVNLGNTSTLYTDLSEYPQNSDNWRNAYAVVTHEFQHKIFGDNVFSDAQWLNEGLSQLAIQLGGYTIESGVTRAFDQILSYMSNPGIWSVTYDPDPLLVNSGVIPPFLGNHYGAGYMWMLYMAEHYDGAIRKIYRYGLTDPVANIEQATGEKITTTMKKFAMANILDAEPNFTKNFLLTLLTEPTATFYSEFKLRNPSLVDDPTRTDDEFDLALRNEANLEADRLMGMFTYHTFDVNEAVGGDPSARLPGFAQLTVPDEQGYPAYRTGRMAIPFAFDVVRISSGNGSDLSVTYYSDPNFFTAVVTRLADKPLP